MSIFKITFIALFICIFSITKATTWDEPWHDQVVKQSESFVLAKIISFDTNKGVIISILKQLAGKPIKDTIQITDFYLLHLCSASAGEGPEFHFKGADSCYFFIKKNDKNEYCIATPTTGFAVVHDGIVVATYRHSYHQARVDLPLYENTMAAIFNNYHALPYDKAYITSFIDKTLALKPAGINAEEIGTFFNQHVALECIYHLGLTDHYKSIVPFLKDTANMHAQISAARALTPYNTPECNQLLINTIGDNKAANDFAKVICIWTLGSHKPQNIKDALTKLLPAASTQENGFGGNIMDPRVCTTFPTVKDALTELIGKL
jgi:hypothetical protein